MGRYAFLILKIVTYNTGKGDKWTICITHSHFTLAEGRHDECYRTRTFFANKEEKVKKLEIEYQQKKKEVEETRQVLKLRKKLYARLRKQKQEEQRLRKGLEELDKEKVSQVRRRILKHLSNTSLFTKYNNSELTEYT